jgi:hypothetical protein
MMLKSLLLTILLCLASTLLFVQAAFSQPLIVSGSVLNKPFAPSIAQANTNQVPPSSPPIAQPSASPEIQEPTTTPAKPNTQPNPNQKAAIQPNQTYDMEAIKEFGKDLYGD